MRLSYKMWIGNRGIRPDRPNTPDFLKIYLLWQLLQEQIVVVQVTGIKTVVE